MAQARSGKVLMTETVQTTMRTNQAIYNSMAEVQSELLKISTSDNYQLDNMVCQVCMLWAIDPRQCSVCKRCTCNECSNQMTNPHECVWCKKKGEYLPYRSAKLGLPNQLQGRAAKVKEQVAKFDCPRACGWVDMTFAELERHTLHECDLREFATMKNLFN